MRLLPWALLLTNLPDDGVDSETDILVFPGRNVAEAIGDVLRDLGCEVSAPEDQQESGWDFDFKTSGRRIWVQISAYEEMYSLVSKDMSRTFTDGLFKRPPSPVHADVMMRLNEALAVDPRFRRVAWYSDQDFGTDQPGATSPVVLDD